MEFKRIRLPRTLASMFMVCIAIVTGITAAQSFVDNISLKGDSHAPITPRAALDSLDTGNARFWQGRLLHRQYPGDIYRADTAHPFAAIVGCMDSRTPTDLMFDRGLGETFGIRIAGNISNPDIIGSLEYAVAVKGVVLIAVIGHSDCGAVKGAISGVQMGSLTQLLDKIKPAIAVVPPDVRPRTVTNPVFVQRVADSNVVMTMRGIMRNSSIVRDSVARGRVMMVGGMYDTRTGHVTFFR
jgi:carbonic anhydrase